MKRKDLVKKLTAGGWWFDRHGSKHDIYTDGQNIEQVPRHTEIGEDLAKKIIKPWGL